MLSEYLTSVANLLKQMECSLGMCIPVITATRESLDRVMQVSDSHPLERQERIVEMELRINDMAAGAQPAPGSLLAQLFTVREQYAKMKQVLGTGQSVAWMREQIVIEGKVLDVLTGAWIDTSDKLKED